MADMENNPQETKEVKETAAKEQKTAPKNKKPSIGKRIGSFFRGMKSELKKIVWFSREQTFRSSVVVIVSIVIFSLFISALDYGFSQGLRWLGGLF